MNLFDLTGQVCVVSGGSGWLGVAIVEALASSGATVFAVSRDRRKALSALNEIAGNICIKQADVRDSSWPELIHSIADETERIDVLVNNAHIGRGGSLRLSKRKDYQEAFDLAVTATAEGINASRDGLISSVKLGGSASIINVASMYGLVAPDPKQYHDELTRNPPYYGAAKAALIQLTKYAAAELAHDGIRVNAISPGPFPAVSVQDDQDFTNRLADKTMLGRVGKPEEIRTAVLYLASPHSSFTTGTVLSVDGGWTAW